MMYGGGFGAPGTRVTKRLGEGSELWAYVKQAVTGSLAINAALALVMFAGPAFLGSWIVPVSTLFWPLLIYALRKIRVDDRQVLGPNIAGLLVWVVWPLLFVTALENRVRWWAYLTLDGAVGRALATVLSRLSLPLWLWALIVGLGALLALRGLLKWYLATFVAFLVLWVAFRLDPADLRIVPVVWDRLRAFGVLYIVAPAGFGLLLAFVMAKEMALPNLEVTAVPASWEELNRATLPELALPGWHPREPELAPMQGTPIIVKGETVAGRIQQLRGELPEPAAGLGVRALWFREVMGRTKAMTRDDAVACGYTRPEWERTIEVLLALKALQKRPQGGHEPNATGKRILTRTIAQDSKGNG